MSRLTEEQKAAAEGAVALVRQRGEHQTVGSPDGGEAYAYPMSEGRIPWGFNRPNDGFNSARGVTK